MTRKELVKKAIQMKSPERIPIYLFNRDYDNSDIVSWNFGTADSFVPQNSDESEWGFVWERLDDTIGQPKGVPLKSWEKFEEYLPPSPTAKGRFRGLESFIEKYNDKYLMGGMGVTGFNLMTFIRGFENVMEDLYFEKENISKLADIVFGFEEGVIKEYGKYGMDAVTFYDDWGMQKSLLISPIIWREFFKPRYKKQFDLIHNLGMDVYFHSCGFCYEIIEDLIEIGADILNFNQPNIYGIEKLGKEFGGKVTFNCPVDIQNTAVTGGKKEIYSETQKLIDFLGKYNGGFIGYVEEYHSIGMSDENYNYCVQALIDLGKY